MTAPKPEPPALRDRALQDLSFIRRTMEGASSFTDVPGWGLVLVGLVALPAAFFADRQPTPERWLAIWLGAAVLASSVGLGAMYGKMRRRVATSGTQLVSVPARRFLLNYTPAILSGAVLTLALVDPFTAGIAPQVTERVLPGLWLLLYGVGVATGGAFSVRVVPMMGLVLMGLGIIALFVPALDGDLAMAAGFGVVQIAFGVLIARRHGG
ncbi:MAG: hypothetical protein KF709_13270 [Gemmatimonadaceae bacterium]|nr:hypothetical protein [Gemmatimonadaceae bacterium]